MTKSICAVDKTLSAIKKYYEINACFPTGRWLCSQMGIQLTAVKSNLRTLAVNGSIEMDDDLKIIGVASLRKSWHAFPLLACSQ